MLLSRSALFMLFALAAALVAVALMSGAFAYGLHINDVPLAPYVGMMIAAGAFYLILVDRAMLSRRSAPSLFALLLFSGLALRILFLASTPILEIDYYRYFYEGRLLTEGLSPYSYPPARVFDQQENPRLGELGLVSPTVPADPKLSFMQAYNADRVSYNHLTSVYPPLTQAVFALAAWLKPFDILVWRLILLTVDIGTLMLLIRLLDALVLPRMAAMIYWLNPIAITETINAAHMDVLLLPFLVGAALLAARGRPALSGAALAGAVAVKIWPVILAPLLFRAYISNPRQLFIKAAPFILITAALLAPQLWAVLFPQADAGLTAYATGWRRNSFLFALINDGLAAAVDAGWIAVSNTGQAARLISYGLLASILLWTIRRPPADAQALITGWLVVTAALFLLSPTGYPWYLLWFLPWLAVRPNLPLLMLTVLLPLYDVRYWLYENGHEMWVHGLIIPLQFAPVLMLLALPSARRAFQLRDAAP